MKVEFQEYINQVMINEEEAKNFGMYKGEVYLFLPDQDITIEDLKNDIVPFLKEYSVKIVILNRNKNIGDEGWKLISEVESLKKLIAINCNISSNEVKHLAKMENLKELDVSSNPIDQVGAKAIASMENLEKLKIDMNGSNDMNQHCGIEGDEALQERDPVIRANYKKYAELSQEVPSLQRIGMFKVKELYKEKQIPESTFQKLDEKFKEKIIFDIENDDVCPIKNRPRI